MSVEEKEFLPPGTVLRERYILDSIAGKGGFGVTYRAWDPVLDSTVAIKEYRRNAERFLTEARVMAQFRSARNLVHVYDFFRENDAAYIVMEFLEGETLKELLKREKKLETGEAVRILAEVLEGLSQIHALGLVHRDIAPDNIFLLKDGRVKLFDFGCARAIGSVSSTAEVKRGFSPPEQFHPGTPAAVSADIYASAASFYRMLTGSPPENSFDVFSGDFRKRKQTLQIPERLLTVLAKGLSEQPENRYSSAEEFKSAVLAATGRDQTLDKKRKRSIILSVLLLLPVVAGAACFLPVSGKKVPAVFTVKTDISPKVLPVTEPESAEHEDIQPQSANPKSTDSESTAYENEKPVSRQAEIRQPEGADLSLLSDENTVRKVDETAAFGIDPDPEIKTGISRQKSKETTAEITETSPEEPEESEAETLPDENKDLKEPPAERKETETAASCFEQGPFQDASGWRYRFADGTELMGGFAVIDGESYYFDSAGLLTAARVFRLGEDLYYSDENGRCLRNQWKYLEQPASGWYYFGSDGRAYSSGWYTIGTEAFHFTDFVKDQG